MTEHTALDNPAWGALTTRQAHLGWRDGSAVRYHPAVSPFGMVGRRTPDAFAALGRLLASDGPLMMQTLDALMPIPGVRLELLGNVLQMIATRAPDKTESHGVIDLGDGDLADMQDLARRTQPGPFGPRTPDMGRYLGIRQDGKLIAMAGERMKPEGYVEISAVCVDEAFRGKGLAARLIDRLCNDIMSHGETPFLHVLDTNRSAIALYERLGMRARKTFLLYRAWPD